MRRSAIVGCLLALLVAPARASQPGDEERALHDELRALRATMEEALNAGDLEKLVAHVTEDVVFTTMNGDVVRGRDGIRAYFAKMMQGEDRVVERIVSHFVPDALSILTEDDVAIAYGHSEDRYELAKGPKFEIEARWSTTLVRRDGRWSIAAFHYSANVFDNPILAAQRRALLGGAVLAAAVAALAGWLVGRFRGRSKRA